MTTSLLDRLPARVRVLFAVGALYVFLVGIGAMGAAFKLLGTGYTEQLLGSATGPFASLFIGILATTLVQSSSTTTSLVVGLVAAGAVPYHAAVYMVMGANVGTTVTNTIVSLGHITRSREYERAFAAATVHDFFNLLVLAVLFPIEVLTGVLDTAADVATTTFQGMGGLTLASPIKVVTKPAIAALTDLSEAVGAGGWGVLVIALLLTFGGLVGLVKVLRRLMVTRFENFFDRVIFGVPWRSLFFGIIFTVLVQSSSVTTSLAVPLVGAGILTTAQILPYTMGANIGTTVTALLASLAAFAAVAPGDAVSLEHASLGLHVAFHHVLFNVFGVAVLWWFRPVPIRLATAFARLAGRNRLLPLGYIILAFYVGPLLIILLSR